MKPDATEPTEPPAISRARPKAWRIVLILLVGAVALGAIFYDNRWGLEATTERWGALDAHSFGSGPDAVVLLHGYASSPDALVPLARGLANEVPARYVLPCAPRRVWSGGYAWFGWPDELGSEAAHRQDVRRARRELVQLVQQLRAEGSRRVVVVGHSMGGRMAMDLGLAMEPKPAAIGLLASGSLATWRIEGLRGQPIFFGVGERDPIFPFAEERRLRDWLRAHGAEVTFFVHGGGHEVGPMTTELAAYLRSALTE